MRTTCVRCSKREPLYAIRWSLDRQRVAQPANERTKFPRCEKCTETEIRTRNRLDKMSPGAVAFVLANGGKI